jgi:hypothetical protein
MNGLYRFLKCVKVRVSWIITLIYLVTAVLTHKLRNFCKAGCRFSGVGISWAGQTTSPTKILPSLSTQIEWAAKKLPAIQPSGPPILVCSTLNKTVDNNGVSYEIGEHRTLINVNKDMCWHGGESPNESWVNEATGWYKDFEYLYPANKLTIEKENLILKLPILNFQVIVKL